MKYLAKCISNIGNPAVIGLFYGIYIVFFVPDATYYLSFAIWSLFLIVLPSGIFIAYNVHRGYFADFDVSNKIKRNSLYKFILLCCLLLLVVLFLGNFDKKVLILFGIVFLHLGLSFWINQKYKVSMHTSCCYLFSMLFIPINSHLSFILASFGLLIMWSRVFLRRHKIIEVMFGMLLGIFNGCLYLFLLTNITK